MKDLYQRQLRAAGFEITNDGILTFRKSKHLQLCFHLPPNLLEQTNPPDAAKLIETLVADALDKCPPRQKHELANIEQQAAKTNGVGQIHIQLLSYGIKKRLPPFSDKSVAQICKRFEQGYQKVMQTVADELSAACQLSAVPMLNTNFLPAHPISSHPFSSLFELMTEAAKYAISEGWSVVYPVDKSDEGAFFLPTTGSLTDSLNSDPDNSEENRLGIAVVYLQERGECDVFVGAFNELSSWLMAEAKHQRQENALQMRNAKGEDDQSPPADLSERGIHDGGTRREPPNL